MLLARLLSSYERRDGHGRGKLPVFNLTVLILKQNLDLFHFLFLIVGEGLKNNLSISLTNKSLIDLRRPFVENSSSKAFA